MGKGGQLEFEGGWLQTDYKRLQGVQLFHNNVRYKYLQPKKRMIDVTTTISKRYTTRYTITTRVSKSYKIQRYKEI